jgi:hypothetical protein
VQQNPRLTSFLLNAMQLARRFISEKDCVVDLTATFLQFQWRQSVDF